MHHGVQNGCEIALVVGFPVLSSGRHCLYRRTRGAVQDRSGDTARINSRSKEINRNENFSPKEKASPQKDGCVSRRDSLRSLSDCELDIPGCRVLHLVTYPPTRVHALIAGESVTKLKSMLTAAQVANPPTKEVSKNGFSFRHPDAPPPLDDVSVCAVFCFEQPDDPHVRPLCFSYNGSMGVSIV